MQSSTPRDTPVVTADRSVLRRAIDAIPEQIWIARADGAVDFRNRRWREYSGLAADGGSDPDLTTGIHPEDAADFRHAWNGAVADGEPFEREARFRRADGSYRWFACRAAPFCDESGTIVEWYGTRIDIDDRRQAEELRAAQARYALLRADVSAAFSQPASLESTLRDSVEAIVRHLDAAVARLWLLSADQRTLELRASAGMYTHLDGPHSRIPVGSMKIGRIAEQRTPHLTNDVRADPRVTDQEWVDREKIVAFAGYPLLVEHRLVGVMAMFARHTLSPDILGILASVADLVAQGVERRRAEEALRESQALLRLTAEQTLEATGRRLAIQSAALTELTASQARRSGAFGERLCAILEACARTLDVERVSVWAFSEDRGAIVCIDLFEAKPARHTAGARLLRAQYPAYFAAVERERLIASDDAYRDQRTHEFSGAYLVENGIGAMLDVPLKQDDRTAGVLCLEHVGGTRVWSTDERNFALSVANLVAAASADEDRREALRRLAESEQLARLVLDTAHDAFVGMGSDGRIVSWNVQAESTFGWRADEVIGRSLAETIIPPSFRAAHLAGMARFHQTGEASVVGRILELMALHRDGHELPVELSITTPITRGNGFYFGAFLRDISDRRQREAQLRQARDSAEAATRAKSEFLANMSHELRTPLNGVLGYAQLMRRDRALGAAHQEALETISRCGMHLLELINDILDLSKIEAGKLEVEPGATDLRRLVVDVRQLIGESAYRKGVGFEVRIDAGLPRLVVLDGRHLRQILINLLGNAVKFTHQGRVVLTIAEQAGRLRFDVSDTGIGVDPESVAMIFEAFGQTREGAQEGGTGLGLTISQRLVRAMAGELHVERVETGGSLFWFDLPLVVARRADGDLASAPDLDSSPGLRLVAGQEITALVVDDHSINRRIIAVLLESMGIQTIAAADGTEGIELAGRHRPEVILMDLRMKGIDGIEATGRLRADPATAAIPVIAVTASPFDDAREAAIAAGCCEFLPKPVCGGDLIAALVRHVGARFEPVAVDAPVAAPAVDEADAHLALAAVAGRLRDAVAIGSLSDIQAIAQELIRGNDHQARLGERIVRLADQLEFDAIDHLVSGGPRDGHDPGV